jgi:diguanylate cyclase (GGDEF)-like protein
MSILEGREARAPVRRGADARTQDFSRRFGDALRAADAAGAEDVVRRAHAAGLPATTVQSRVMAPAMHRIGDLWAAEAITVADEHLATAICQRVLTSLYVSLQHRPGPVRRRILLAAVQGEHHAMGLRMVADVLEGAGHDVLHLGCDVAAAPLVAAVVDHEPDLVCLAATLRTGGSRLEEALHRIQQVRPELPVLLGGQGVPRRLRDAGWPFVEHSDELLDAVDVLFAAPPQMPAASNPLEVGLQEEAGSLDVQGIGTTEDRLVRLVSEAGDVARQQAQHARVLYDSAFRDAVTELPNRRAFDERLAKAPAPRSVLLMIDLDGFKAVNDTYGHAEGDLVLRRVGDLLRQGLRLDDFAARFGGDEFAVLLCGVNADEAASVAERLRVTAEVTLAEHCVTMSIGAAAADAPDAAARADRALYLAKQAGRNRVTFDGPRTEAGT